MADSETVTPLDRSAPTEADALAEAQRRAAKSAKETAPDSALAKDVAANPTDQAQDDYFGFERTEVTYLPDGVSYVTHKALNEGQRRKYLNSTNRSVEVERASGNASINTAPGDERYELLKSAVTGWNLKRGDVPVPFNAKSLDEFLTKADPRVIDDIERDVRLMNPWLLQDMEPEDIDKEIESLEKMKAKILEERAGKDA